MEEENKKEKEGASFSMQVKEELSNVEGASRHCQLAELAALVLCCGRLVNKKMDDDDKDSCINKTLLFESENETVLRKYFTFVQKTFNIELMRVYKGNGYALELNEQDTKTVLHAIELSEGEPLENCVADSRLLLRNCCRRAFVRGCFLASGSISAPQKGYHFEIVTQDERKAAHLQEIICSFQIDAKIVLRKKSYVVYVKEGAQIVDMLAIMEANVALMNLENIRILKEMRNSVNRKVNCETANINKTVNAAVKQIEDIRLIEQKKGFHNLNEGLAEIAELRLQYPEATLKELGMMLNPQVGKSGVNHRLRKLSEIADELRMNEEDLL